MARIAEISGGNPFYALELARAIDMGSANAHSRLPGTLAELMRMRIGRLDPGVKDLLLVATSVATPTMELLAQVAGTTSERAAELLSEAQAKGILAIDGNTVRFPHPLLARSVYTDASPAERRATHRLLAESVILPELKARHMALAASRADPETLKALDTAADVARARGAPAAAAELVELAIGLGEDKPSRRIRAVEHHFQGRRRRPRPHTARVDHRSTAARAAARYRAQPDGGNPHLRRHLRRRRRAPRARTRRRGAQPSPSRANPDVVGVRAGDGRPVRSVVTQCPRRRDTRRGDALSAAGQSCTRDVGQHDVPVRTRHRRG